MTEADLAELKGSHPCKVVLARLPWQRTTAIHVWYFIWASRALRLVDCYRKWLQSKGIQMPQLLQLMSPHDLRQMCFAKRLSESDVVAAVGDVFVTCTFCGDMSFWDLPVIARKLYSLLATIHHAGSNGLQALEDYHEGFWVGVIVFARQVLEELDVPNHLAEFRHFEAFLADLLVEPQATQFPSTEPEMRALQKKVECGGRDWPDRVWNYLSLAGESFIRPRNEIIERKAVAWISANAEEIAPMIDHNELMKHPLLDKKEV